MTLLQIAKLQLRLISVLQRYIDYVAHTALQYILHRFMYVSVFVVGFFSCAIVYLLMNIHLYLCWMLYIMPYSSEDSTMCNMK